MKYRIFYTLILSVGAMLASCSDDDNTVPQLEQPFVMPDKAYVLAEQSRRAIVIMDAETNRNVWSWDPYTAGIPYSNVELFKNPSEVKPVFNKRYILMTASGGAVALIRIADHKLMFYGNAGQNPHSAEILPDGNIVTASSTDHLISTFVTDTVKVFCTANKTLKLGDAHNVVWDRKRELMYATASVKNSSNENCIGLFSFKYNNDRNNPQLTNMTRIYTMEDDRGAHDLFPVFGEDDKLWLTTANNIWKYDVAGNTFTKTYDLGNIKSISNSTEGVILLSPTEEWWAEGLINDRGETLFTLKGAKLYKGRWVVDNTFSYPETHNFVLGNNE